MLQLSALDYLVFLIYFLGISSSSGWRTVFSKKVRQENSPTLHFLQGRSLTLPIFVFSLVSTWYGGILGVGEVNYRFGLSRWLMVAAPYYVFALIFSLFFVKRIRATPSLCLTEHWFNTLGKRMGVLGGVLIFILSSPAPYIWMLAVLLHQLTSVSYTAAVLGTCIWIGIISMKRNFSELCRTNTADFFVMFGGFILILPFCWYQWGDFRYLQDHLPDTHLSVFSQQPWHTYLAWFLSAGWTLVDPSFHQRVRSAKSDRTAFLGILISLVFWMIFDALTLITALYARAGFPNLENPGFCYSTLATAVLPSGLFAIFYLSLISTIVSTLNSFTFSASQTLYQLLEKWDSGHTFTQLNRMSVTVTLAVSLFFSLVIPSAIELWSLLACISLPALVLTLLKSYGYFPFLPVSTVFRSALVSAISSTVYWVMSYYQDKLFNQILEFHPIYIGILAIPGWILMEWIYSVTKPEIEILQE